ncbi:MAG: EF-P beta-lysylation protein EpmB [Idiomarinaceae bacterium HL-53]|nr:MAG: EF-P beta-lysylation protein EpmB [Idiomarinaceae bacterium HL-53]CUS48218.1 EF-P beta-lysylation protein EpmB [Idiomarinaceae bacterium HL-53]
MTAKISVRPVWQSELAQSYKSPAELARALELPDTWVKTHESARQLFPMLVPKPFAALMKKGEPNDPLLLQVAPHASEYLQASGFSHDPLQENGLEGPSGLLHKYESRLLIVFKGGCAVNCRYCFRRHFPYEEHSFGKTEQEAALQYISQHPEVNEVILSGGDPLMASDPHIINFVKRLEAIASITRLRIHSRLPVVIPSRLTQALARELSSTRLKIILVLHVNHANELSQELKHRLAEWRSAGVWLLNQTVLLKGVNNSVEALSSLSEKLFDWHVLPYYLHMLDRVQGAAHFDLPFSEVEQLYRGLLAKLPGFLVPKLVKEIPGESSKTPLLPRAHELPSTLHELLSEPPV